MAKRRKTGAKQPEILQFSGIDRDVLTDCFVDISQHSVENSLYAFTNSTQSLKNKGF